MILFLDRRVCSRIFAAALDLGQRDSGTRKLLSSREKWTVGQGNFFVPGQKDQGTSRLKLSRWLFCKPILQRIFSQSFTPNYDYYSRGVCNQEYILRPSYNLLPYPCSHFYFDINFGNRLYSKEKRRAWPLLF